MSIENLINPAPGLRLVSRMTDGRVTIKNEGQVRGLGFVSGLVSKSKKKYFIHEFIELILKVNIKLFKYCAFEKYCIHGRKVNIF